MSGNLTAFTIALVASFGAAVAIYLLLCRSLTALLDEVVRLPSGTTFYVRVFGLCLFLSAASGVLGTAFDFKPDAKFMEYVWRVATVLSSALSSVFLVLIAFLTVMTVLVVVLRRRD